ncbi:MAG: hypothetical protein IPG71_01770 [bacterium]|nr:hypothetical protein [bacterium]
MRPTNPPLRTVHGLWVSSLLLLCLSSVAFAGDVWQQTRVKPFEDEIGGTAVCEPLRDTPRGVPQIDREDSTTAGVAPTKPAAQSRGSASATVVQPTPAAPCSPVIPSPARAENCAD